MTPTPEAGRFVWGGTPHVAALLLLVVLAAGLVWCGRRLRDGRSQAWLSRGFALTILLGQGAMQIETMLPQNWTIEYSLPFQLCDLAWMIAVYALWTRRAWAASVLYYWGLTLTTQGLITPHLDLDFPSFEFGMFFYGHGAVVLAAIYLTWGVGLQPGWNDYRRALVGTLVWGLSVFTFNSLAGTNYGYLNHKPPMQSAIDFLGPYPIYLASELLLATTIWSLMTWPWTRDESTRPSAARSPAHTGGGLFPSAHGARSGQTENA